MNMPSQVVSAKYLRCVFKLDEDSYPKQSLGDSLGCTANIATFVVDLDEEKIDHWETSIKKIIEFNYPIEGTTVYLLDEDNVVLAEQELTSSSDNDLLCVLENRFRALIVTDGRIFTPLKMPWHFYGSALSKIFFDLNLNSLNHL